jgi:hypothetical protein
MRKIRTDTPGEKETFDTLWTQTHKQSPKNPEEVPSPHVTIVEQFCGADDNPNDSRRFTTVASQVDPSGKDQHEKGAKLDAGKPRVSLVLRSFSLALIEVSKVGTFGADKYTDNGWIEVPNGIERYDDALFRHLLNMDRSDLDKESRLKHQAHAAWNALAELQLMLMEEAKNENSN